jgi:hypothetical protein
VLSALRQVGATIGVAVLGTLLAKGYTSHLHLPAGVNAAARQSVAAGVGVATRLGSAQILGDVRSAFVHGMDVMLTACAGIALVSGALALAFIPHRADGRTAGVEP